ncbi:MAG: hypothetical protein HFF18_14560 [Oscillospiraceae bacterium]|nr:hypothetical protein [Oscillospiraceae bacterium]
MKLHDNQLKLVQHLARFNLLDYPSCLELLDTAGTGDRIALSYAFRPLTKNGYLSKRKDGSVAIQAKGQALFPEMKPLISVGGNSSEGKRIMDVSRMAALMERSGVPCSGSLTGSQRPYFIPSACWRKIAPGILSTTRFVGMLIGGEERLAVYDIGNGHMEWQVRAEGSLFYTKYGSYETKATGMIFVCQTDRRNDIARNIIRQTMWSRRQLLSDGCVERNRPTRWSRSPIKLRAQYEHVYLTTPQDLNSDLQYILSVKKQICRQRASANELHDPAQSDYEKWPYRFFANPATDLLKYVYFFSAVKGLLQLLAADIPAPPQVRYAICFRPQDMPILQMYPDVLDLKGLKLYEYRPK